VLGQGTGLFAEGPVAAGLAPCFKSASTVAGEVCPVATVSLNQYESDLAATRMGWVIDPS